MPKKRRPHSRLAACYVTALLGAVTSGCGGARAAGAAESSEARTAEPSVGAAQVNAPVDVTLQKGCSPSGPERCFDAVDDNCNGVVDEGCGLSTGLLQFVVAWNKPTADVDLEVTDPNGELAEIERSSESGLVKERDCPGQNDDCHGQNVENVFLEGNDVVRGAYRVRVRLEKLGSEDPPVEITLGARVGPKTYRARLRLSAAGDERVLVFRL